MALGTRHLKILFGLLLLFASNGWASDAATSTSLLPPSIQMISQTLTNLETNPDLSQEHRSTLTSIYEQTLDQLQVQQQYQQQLEALDREIQQTPKLTLKVQRELEHTEPLNENSLAARYRQQSLLDLEQGELQLQDQLQTLKQQLERLNSQISTEQGRPERAQNRIDQISTEQAELSTQLAKLLDQPEQTTQQKATQAFLLSRQQTLQVERVLQRQQLRIVTPRLDLLLTQRALAQEHHNNLNLDLHVLQAQLILNRRSDTEQALAQIDQQQLVDPRLHQIRDENNRLGQQLLRLNDQQEQLQKHSNQTSLLQQRISQLEQAIELQNIALEQSPELGRLLLQQRKALPNLELYADLDKQITDLRLKQFQRYQLRQALADIPQKVSELLAATPTTAEQQTLLKQVISKQLGTQRNLLDKQQQLLNQNLTLAVELKLNQKQLQQQINQLRQQLEQQLFWLPTSAPIGPAWLQQLPQQLLMELQHLPRFFEQTQIKDNLRQQPLAALMIIILVAALLLQRGRILRRLNVLAARVGNTRQESVWLTPEALALQALLLLPLILPLVFLGYLIGDSPHISAQRLGLMLKTTPLFLGLLFYAERLFLPQGIVIQHFQRRPVDYRPLRRMIKITIATLLPMILSVTLLGLEARSSQLLTLFGCSMLSLFLYRLKQHFGLLFQQPLLNRLFWTLMIAAPTGLVLLLLQGYALTALNLLAHLLLTILLIGGWALLRETINRSILVASHKLAYSRAADRLEAQREEKEIELPNMDLATVNRQTLRLTNSLLIVGLVLALYWLWLDIWSLMGRLDAITLAAGSEGISLTGLLLALLIFVATLILSRNLPGLMEMTLLSRLNLSNGISYATTSLLSYSIIAIGLVWGLSALGVSWDKLQWLVAALGVGLGFGLQEIFANFMSGLILLFERPIRIGDTVTIGELSGTVSKIRIRATTITDWDNKEIVIPNKQFITEQLINWTLSDPMTRITIRVGVAYGSDLKLAHQLLLQAASEQDKVLTNPTPAAYFLNFGDSTLDHELRVYVSEMTDRLPLTHALNQRIDELFKDHAIEIAFPQRDLHLRSWPDSHNASLDPQEPEPEPEPQR